MQLGLAHLALAIAGGAAAGVVDIKKPEWVQHVAGREIEPGVIGALGFLALGALTKSPLLASLGAGAAVLEGGKYAATKALGALPPGPAPQHSGYLPPGVYGEAPPPPFMMGLGAGADEVSGVDRALQALDRWAA